jgi:hypothetical protein
MTETIKGAKELIRIYKKKRIPTFVMGLPGVGKSEAYEQIAQEEKGGFIDLRVGQMDPVDLLGVPTVDQKKGTTKWSLPDFWPQLERDGEHGIILFDELPDCSRLMQSALYQIFLNHKAGVHPILPGWYCCAAGNRRGDKAAAGSVSTALANRFAWIDVEPDHECFDEYAAQKGMHEYVRGFLKSHPGKIHCMEGADMRAFASPRAWEKASRIVGEPAAVRFRLLRGLVGEGVAGEFESWLKTVNMPSLEEIERAPKTCMIPQEPSSRYALSAMLSRKATAQNFEKIMTYVCRADFGRDFEICTILDATKRDLELTNTRAFVDFATRNQDITI